MRVDSPMKTGRNFIEILRKSPAVAKPCDSSAAGGTHHISFGLPLLSGGVDTRKAKFVAFNSSGEAVTALLGGHVDVYFRGHRQRRPHS